MQEFYSFEKVRNFKAKTIKYKESFLQDITYQSTIAKST